jgi:hypothetical protein
MPAGECTQSRSPRSTLCRLRRAKAARTSKRNSRPMTESITCWNLAERARLKRSIQYYFFEGVLVGRASQCILQVVQNIKQSRTYDRGWVVHVCIRKLWEARRVQPSLGEAGRGLSVAIGFVCTLLQAWWIVTVPSDISFPLSFCKPSKRLNLDVWIFIGNHFQTNGNCLLYIWNYYLRLNTIWHYYYFFNTFTFCTQ